MHVTVQNMVILNQNVIIADVAVRKRHQRQDEILIIIASTILESAKLFFCRKHAHF